MINQFNTKGMTVIVPVYNEEKTIPIFCPTLDSYSATLPFEIELVFVDDGSEDATVDCLKDYHFKNIKKVKLIKLSKNFGFHAAAYAGICNATFDICTWMGVDLQEPLEILPISYDKLSSSEYDAVYFEKRTVKVSRINRMCSKIYSHLMRKYAVKRYSNDGTATVAFGGKIKDYLNHNVELNSDLVLQILDAGFKYITIPMDYDERSAGESKWTFSKKIKSFIDSFVSYSYMPIRLVSIAGGIFFLFGLIIGIITVVNRITDPNVQIGYATIACLLSLGFGTTDILLGIIAEYLWRTLDAARKRPVYIVSDIIELTDFSEE